MKLAFFLALALATLPVQAADWRDSITSPRPGGFAPMPSMKASYRFGWGAVPAAQAEFEFARTGNGLQRLTMTTTTTGAVRAIWRMDARHEAWCRLATLLPTRMNQVETYRDEVDRTNVTYDAEGVSRVHESRLPNGDLPPGQKPAKMKRFKFPNVLDLQTVLLAVRSQRLKPGDTYRFVVYPSTSAYLTEVSVVGPDPLDVAGRNWSAVKMNIRLQSIGRDLKLGPHKKFRRASAWLSDDPERLLLKAEAEVFVGSVWVELERVERTLR